jgi:hypothetical protein
MSDLIRVWLLPDVGGRVAIQANTRPFDDPRWEECIAVPRADFDAREAEIVALRQERDAATARANTATVAANLMRARADTANERAERTEALLREARVAGMYSGLANRIDAHLDNPSPSPGGGTTQVGGAAERAAGIVTPAGPTPTPDDRRGEDGAWCERGTE